MNRALSILAVIGSLLCGADVAQAAVRLKADATGLNDGTSWANAFTNAHDAVAAAIEGDGIVYAAGGKYVCTNKFTVARDFAIYGGFAGASESETLDDRDPAAHPTVFSGDVAGDDYWVNRLIGATKDSNGTAIWNGLEFIPPPDEVIYSRPADKDFSDNTDIFFDQTAGDLTLDGVAITGFKGVNTTDDTAFRFSGGGTLTMNGVRYVGNAGALSGGKKLYAIRVIGSTFVAKGCAFVGNAQGIYVKPAAAAHTTSAENCTFSHAYVHDGCAGAVFMASASASLTLTDCTIRRCYYVDGQNTYNGATLLRSMGPLMMTRCAVEDNRLTVNADRMAYIEGSATITDCVFRRNIRNSNALTAPSGVLGFYGQSARIINGCLFEDNEYTSTKADASGNYCTASCVMSHWGTLSVLNTTFRNNSVTCPEGSENYACTVGCQSWYNAGGSILYYAGLAVVNCIFDGNTATAGSAGKSGEIACNDRTAEYCAAKNGTPTVAIANTVTWPAATDGQGVVLPAGFVPEVVNSALKNFDATDYELGAQDFMENIYTVADPLEGAVLVEKEGCAPQLKLAAQSPLARKGRPIYLKDKTPYIYWDSTETDKPWYNLVDKSMKAKALSGFTKDGPYAADAFGADRKAHSALGPLNTDPLGMLMLVR